MLRECPRAHFLKLNALRVRTRLRGFGNRNRCEFFLLEPKQAHGNACGEAATAAQRKFCFDARMRPARCHCPQPAPAARECSVTRKRNDFSKAAADRRVSTHQRRSLSI